MIGPPLSANALTQAETSGSDGAGGNLSREHSVPGAELAPQQPLLPFAATQ